MKRQYLYLIFWGRTFLNKSLHFKLLKVYLEKKKGKQAESRPMQTAHIPSKHAGTGARSSDLILMQQQRYSRDTTHSIYP